MPSNILTHELLKTLIHYDAETGIFTRINSPRNRSLGVIKLATTTRGYITIFVSDKQYTAHRLAWFYTYGVWPKQHLDHVNRIKTDNRLCNLREADDSLNNKNMGLKKCNTSGYKGVYYYKSRGNWQAQIRADGKRIFIGYFKTAAEAGKAYDDYAKQHHAEFYYKVAA